LETNEKNENAKVKLRMTIKKTSTKPELPSSAALFSSPSLGCHEILESDLKRIPEQYQSLKMGNIDELDNDFERADEEELRKKIKKPVPFLQLSKIRCDTVPR